MIPLQDYIDALMQGQEYYVNLTKRQAYLLRWEQYDTDKYLLEDNKDTFFPGTDIILPELPLGEFRLWYKEAWENNLQERQSRLEQQDKQKLKQMLADYLKS